MTDNLMNCNCSLFSSQKVNLKLTWGDLLVLSNNFTFFNSVINRIGN